MTSFPEYSFRLYNALLDKVRAILSGLPWPMMDRGSRKRIWGTFSTHSSLPKEVGKGTGLGLSICHGIISEHSGRIYAESQLDKGATFVMELPISKQ